MYQNGGGVVLGTVAVYDGADITAVRDIAAGLAAEVSRGSAICLTGGLGAGKTEFAKAFIRALGVNDDVTSPTFALMNVYGGAFPVYHFDVYRLSGAGEFAAAGLDEYLYGGGVSVVEWADIVAAIIPKDAVWVDLERDGDDTRRVTVKKT